MHPCYPPPPSPPKQALAEREEAVRNGKLATVVFIRDKNAKGHEVRPPAKRGGEDGAALALHDRCHRMPPLWPALHRHPPPPMPPPPHPLTLSCQVSGYIDYGHRLASEAWEPVFDRRRRLMPRPGDLSYFNWDTRTCTSDATENFQARTLTFPRCSEPPLPPGPGWCPCPTPVPDQHATPACVRAPRVLR